MEMTLFAEVLGMDSIRIIMDPMDGIMGSHHNAKDMGSSNEVTDC